MTTSELRTYFTAADLPDSLQPAIWMHITSVRTFVDLHLARLDSPSPLLRRLAEKNLQALHRTMSPAPYRASPMTDTDTDTNTHSLTPTTATQ